MLCVTKETKEKENERRGKEKETHESRTTKTNEN